MSNRRNSGRHPRRNSPSTFGAAAALMLIGLALAVLLGSSVFAPQATPGPSAVALATPAAPSLPAPSASPAAAPSASAPTASASPSPAPPTAVPLPSFSLAPSFEEFYPSIAPSTPLGGLSPDGTPIDGAPGDGGPGDGAPGDGPLAVPGDGRATRVVISSLRIDLPVVPGDLKVRGNRNNYPLCDVAQWLTIFGQPGEVGSAYIYAHAQRGMFLPMLRASWRNNGRAMIGARVEVYTSDLKLHVYEIVRVKRHSTDLKIAYNVPAGEHQLVLQTSEGPPGHRPVLQVLAKPMSVHETTAARALPTPRPRACLPRR